MAQWRMIGTSSKMIDQVVTAIYSCLSEGGKVLSFGNGGSAADAQHFAAELIGRFDRNRKALAALALTTDTSAITAIANDFGYEEVFARQVSGLGSRGDLAIGISTSGRSPSVVNGIRHARELGMTTVALTGGDGGHLARCADIALTIPSGVTARVQECHIAVIHLICELLDDRLFGSGAVLDAQPQKIVTWEQLDMLRLHWKNEKHRVVWTNGCFDVLHIGHVRFLESARALGDVLVVGVNADHTATALKGPGRPVFPAIERAEMLAALAAVSHVAIFDEPTPTESLLRLRPAVHCKGADYASVGRIPDQERAAIHSGGGRMEFIEMVPDSSTTLLLARLSNNIQTDRAASIAPHD